MPSGSIILSVISYLPEMTFLFPIFLLAFISSLFVRLIGR